MLDMKYMFIAVMVLGLLSVSITGGLLNKQLIEQNIHLIIGIASGAVGSIVIFKSRNNLIFAIKYKDKKLLNDKQLAEFLAVDSVDVKHDHFISNVNNRMIGHAWIRIISIPYSLDDLDRDKKMHMVGNFARVLSSFSFPYEYKVRVLPVSADAILSQIDRKINSIRLTLSSQGTLKDPKKETQLKNLERMKDRILEGEGILDVAFAVHIMCEGENQQNIVNRLNENCKSMMATLESSLNVRAERLSGGNLITVMQEFFTAGTKISPSKTNRMLTWDLSYLAPIVNPKKPPIDKLLSGVYMGKTLDGGIFSLDVRRSTNPHMVVLGLTGSGKSTTVKTYISRNYDLYETPTVIIDHAGEYGSWVQSRNGKVIDMHQYAMNLFSLGKTSVTDKVGQLTDSFSIICDFNPLQRMVFSSYLRTIYANSDSQSLTELINLMTTDLETLKPNRQKTVIAIIDRVKGLTSGPFDTTGKPFIALNDIVNGFVCIDLSKLSSNPMRSMVAYTVLQYIDSIMRLEGTSDSIKLCVVLDEAWKVAKHDDSLAVTVVKEGRKFGYQLIVSTQDVDDISKKIISNAGTRIFHQLDLPEYVRYVKDAISLNEMEISKLKNLGVGEALIKLGNDPRVFVAKIDMEKVDVAEAPINTVEPISNEEVNSPISAESASPSDNSAKNENILPSIGKLDNLSPQQIYAKLSEYAKKLLEAITKEPELNTTEYYNKLGINAYQGNKARAELELHKIIEGKELPKIIGKGREGRALRLTKIGSKVVNQENDFRHGGAVHKRIISLIARKCEGHKIEHEYPIGEGKQVDLVIDRRIAIEVETRDFSESNITKNLQAGFEKVIVVCRTEHQAIKFRQSLSKTAPSDSRVRIVDIASLLDAQTLEDVFQ